MEFEWDPAKSDSNFAKHGVSFEEASLVFQDVLAITVADPNHSGLEVREITIGMVNGRYLVTVCHTDRNGKRRIISARRASPRERRIYEEI
jgi:hypothetical protein